MKKENIIYGIRPIIEAVKSGKEIDKILIQTDLNNELYFQLRKLINEFKIPFQYVPVKKLNRITSKNHQGVICFISNIVYHNIENLLPGIYEDGKLPLLLILDRITDVRNMGAIARTAECAGLDAIIIPEKGSAQINSDTIKASAGSLYKIPVCRCKNLKNTIEYLKESGVQIIAATEKAGNYYTSADFTKPTAIIMGSEENGVSGEYLKRSDFKVKIPILGDIESLNVSVATGVILYEAVNQRRK
ncbi:MAG: 23S rRNA (guanosine(2251)-2'-O)-methyltransferase RlmB [Bacteroidetes bacterium]|nr:23S rRNA (guanosine(2251)-2'-O)-methyltransferase RlmB [Bacteroidota bacterium]MCK4287809.1 23S rRNA (guanosine(2251)-2'-O)-methyltransferase RlmB [Bacteroidales bacterium]MCK4360428.1 23S rRNA (guanosine(2251)-2'-O)-methyltransferase RlmB [Bacteroidales bacterium]MCK4407005.1 23S rRNA (guanosine(2251)-2'-O)-methyltransferase RlmB [Bacteroidales bacterium]MCK4638038.1 23S rRNA (guanosine(2251)-2'-O)-methyltransferase RlmB [Bacteroidales bacterium]